MQTLSYAKNNLKLTVVLFMLLALFACGGSKNSTPEAAYKKMTIASKNKNCSEVYESLDIKSQGVMDAMIPGLLALAAEMEGNKTELEKVKNLSGKEAFIYMCKTETEDSESLIKTTEFVVIEAKSQQDKAVLTIKHTNANPEVVVMVKDNKKWKYNIEGTDRENKKFQAALKEKIDKFNKIALEDLRNVAHAQLKYFQTKKQYANSIKQLVDNGVKINISNDSKLFTTSYSKGKSYCVYGFHPDGNRFRRYYGPNNDSIDSMSKDEMLISAVGLGMNDDQTDFIKSLIEQGANVNGKNDNGYPILMWSIAADCPNVCKVLITDNTDVNLKGPGGSTALMLASYRGWTNIAKELVAKGADLNVKSKKGKTALGLAKAQSHSEIIKLLEDAGAKG